MKKFEYRKVKLDLELRVVYDSYPRDGLGNRYDNEVDFMDFLGMTGWELCNIMDGVSRIYYFKRELPKHRTHPL